MDYLPQGNRVALGESVEGRSTPAGRMSSSSAVATPVRTASGPPTGRGPGRSPSLEIMPRPGDTSPPGSPGRHTRCSTAWRARTRRAGAGLLGLHQGRPRRRLRRGACSAGLRGRARRWPVPGGPGRRAGACALVLLAMGFLGPQGSGQVESSVSSSRQAEQCPARPGLYVLRSWSLRRGDAGGAVAHRLGHRRGSCRRAQGVDAWLMGSSSLPRPIGPTDRPLAV